MGHPTRDGVERPALRQALIGERIGLKLVAHELAHREPLDLTCGD